MHHPTDRIAHTTDFVTPVVEHWLEREIAQWVHSTKDRSDDPSHNERMLLPQSYISLPVRMDSPTDADSRQSVSKVSNVLHPNLHRKSSFNETCFQNEIHCG